MLRPLTRRELLVGGGAGLAGLALAACGANTIDTVRRGSGATTGSAGTLGATGTTAEAATGTTAAARTAPVTLDTATVAQLDQLLADGMLASGLPGIDIAVWIGDQEWRRTQGVRDLTFSLPYRADDAARIASITKTFAGTAVLQLVDQGKLALDDRLETYVPGIANGNEITIRQLLGMQSGIFDFTSDEAFVTKFDADPTLPWTDADTLAIIKANPPEFAPGAKTVYCDSNYALLGMIVGKVAGRPVADVINTDVVAKLGLKSTTYPATAAMPDPHPTAYLPDIADPKSPYPFDNAARPPKAVNEVNPAVAGAAGAVVSNVTDLKAWVKELTDGSLLTPATQAERRRTNLLDGQKVVGYGLGIMQVGQFWGHTGAIIGYNSVALRLPDQDATFVAVSNESTNFTTPTTDKIMLPILSALYPDQLK